MTALLAPRPRLKSVRSFTNAPDGARISFVLAGRGRAVVLVPGLGRGADMWSRQMGALAARYRVLAVENRGSGRSDKPAGPYTIEGMAEDLAAVLDHTGIESADVVGASMGGFVALAFALAYPERLRRLVLLSTSLGGAAAVPMPPETWRVLQAPPGRNDAERMLSAVRLGFSSSYFEERFREIAHTVCRRLAFFPPREAWLAQARAGAAFDVADRAREIEAETLVLTGTDDRVLPAANSRILAASLRRARLVEFPGAGHYVMIERAREVNRAAIEFLKESAR